MAAATKISVDATTVAVLSKLDGIFTLEVEQPPALKAFLNGQHVFTLLPFGFVYTVVKHRGG